MNKKNSEASFRSLYDSFLIAGYSEETAIKMAKTLEEVFGD